MTTTALRVPRPRSATPTGDTLALLGPVLVSDLPPAAPARPGLWSRVRDELAERRDRRAFEAALSSARGSECGDLLAAQRRV